LVISKQLYRKFLHQAQNGGKFENLRCGEQKRLSKSVATFTKITPWRKTKKAAEKFAPKINSSDGGGKRKYEEKGIRPVFHEEILLAFFSTLFFEVSRHSVPDQ
jgi:hypothetical protein